MNILDILNKKNIIYQLTNKNKIINYIKNNNKINLYCGFDPTNDSLHIGHLIILFFLKYILKENHNVFIIIGDSTSLIGDPSFRKFERKIKLDKNIISNFSKKIYKQINILFKKYKNLNILYNSKWFNKINIIKFLFNIGSKFKINNILKKEFIKNRLNNNNNKLNFKEFSYIILQSYDFLYLYKKYNVILQVGGSDQWSNIVSGIKLIKNIYNKNTYGITFNILTDNGKKISKSNKKDIIWLDNKKTNFFKFYQFWLNINDDDVYKYLNIFTNINLKLFAYIKKNNKYRYYLYLKRIIANKLTKFVHGTLKLNIAIKITKNIFYKNFNNLNILDFNIIYKNKINIIVLKYNDKYYLNDILILVNLSNSKNNSKILIKQNSIKINNNNVNNIKYIISKNDIIYNKYTFIKKGKKEFYLIKWKFVKDYYDNNYKC